MNVAVAVAKGVAVSFAGEVDIGAESIGAD